MVARLSDGRRLIAVAVVLLIAAALIVALYRTQVPQARELAPARCQQCRRRTPRCPRRLSRPSALAARPGHYGAAHHEGCRAHFDAGPKATGLFKILTVLAEQRVPATFFVTGNWVTANPAAISPIRAAGHRVGNRSMIHPSFPNLPDAAISDQVLNVQRRPTLTEAVAQRR